VITHERAIALIQEAMLNLRRAGLLDKEIVVDEDTILLGMGSELDSLAFVTLVSDLEDGLSRETGRDQFLVLDDLHEFNGDNPSLSVRTLAPYLTELSGRA
jgi:acyl carrier protein